MKFFLQVAIALFPFYVEPSFSQTKNQLRQADFIVKRINIIPMNRPDSMLRNQILLVEKGKISYIGDYKSFKRRGTKAKIVSGRGKYAMPGMADMHCHFPDSIEIRKYFLLNLLGGVTTLRSMRGQEGGLNEMQNTFGVPKLHLSAVISEQTNLSDIATDSLISAFKNHEFDFLKVFSIRDSTTFYKLMEAARAQDLPICGHYLKNVGLSGLAVNGYKSIEHFGGLEEAFEKGSAFFKDITEILKTNNVYQCPTLDWYQLAYYNPNFKTLKRRAGLKFISDSLQGAWRQSFLKNVKNVQAEKSAKRKEVYAKRKAAHLAILDQLNRRGVKILTGLDAGDYFSVPGFAMIEEMTILKEAGLSNYQILESATVNAAKYFNEFDKWGTIEVGKEANMIILPTNPLTKLTSVSHSKGVFLNSFYYKPKSLRKHLRQVSR